MQLSEKTKRFWAFAVSFGYPLIILLILFRFGRQDIEEGMADGQRALKVALLLGLPTLLLIYQNFIILCL